MPLISYWAGRLLSKERNRKMFIAPHAACICSQPLLCKQCNNAEDCPSPAAQCLRTSPNRMSTFVASLPLLLGKKPKQMYSYFKALQRGTQCAGDLSLSHLAVYWQRAQVSNVRRISVERVTVCQLAHGKTAHLMYICLKVQLKYVMQVADGVLQIHGGRWMSNQGIWDSLI